jgi:iron complex outermembrane receptor protein
VDSLRTYNPAGTEKPGTPYDNQVDNYKQTHAQLIYNQQLSKNWHLNLTGHYTRGIGFYEEYKLGQLTSDYGLQLIFDPGTGFVDLVRQRWLDNHFSGIIGSVNHRSTDGRFDLKMGGAVSRYLGDHYGTVEEVISEVFAVYLPPNYRYYLNRGEKSDANIFAKMQYALLPKLNGFLDLQGRWVDYYASDNQLFVPGGPLYKTTRADHLFFNPKAGIFCEASKTTSLYASYAVGQKEPNRNDFLDATTGATPKPERLYNTEIGAKYRTERLALSANFYLMKYRDQLVLTGQINDTGAPIRTNVPDSYRRGVELSARALLGRQFIADANASFSRNKIKGFTEYVDNWDTGQQAAIEQGTTDIAFSPKAVAFGRLAWGASQSFATDGQGLSLSLAAKHVGRQFMDNTSNENARLDAYTTFEAQLHYALRPSFCKELSFNLLVQNLLDARYSSNAWTYRYQSSEDYSPFDPYTRSEGNNFYNLTGYYPQAGRNFLLAVAVKF